MNNRNHLIKYRAFSPFKNILAFTTSRKTLPVAAPRFTGNDRTDYLQNRKLLAKVLGISPRQFVFPRQTHSNIVNVVEKVPEKEISGADALITNSPGICLCIQTADCVPILLFDPKKKVIAAIHAGWRGTVNNITGIAVNKMVSEYDSSPEDIIAVIGPSISGEVYEVGEEVVHAVKTNFQNTSSLLEKHNGNKCHFNLWEANRRILLKHKLSSDNVEVTGDCSFLKEEYYFSARRDGIDTGRIVTGIMLLD